MISSSIKNAIKNNGYRLTKARSAIIEIFCISHEPINAQRIQKKLDELQILVNKTTVYRELNFLINQSIIQTVQLTPDTTSYELLSRKHHHHLVCNKCGRIEDVILENEPFLEEVKKQTSFKLDSHSLEFYGQCIQCK